MCSKGKTPPVYGKAQHRIKSAVWIIFLDANKYIAVDYLVTRVHIYEKALTGV